MKSVLIACDNKQSSYTKTSRAILIMYFDGFVTLCFITQYDPCVFTIVVCLVLNITLQVLMVLSKEVFKRVFVMVLGIFLKVATFKT